MDELTLAYLAGLFDGDGYFGVHVYRQRKNFIYMPRVVIKLIDREPIELVIAVLNDKIGVGTEPSTGRSQKTMYVANYEGFNLVEPVARALLPYLRIKQRQAQLLLDMCEVRARYGTQRTYVTGTYQRTLANGTVVTANSKGYPPEMNEKLGAIHQQIMRLNQRQE